MRVCKQEVAAVPKWKQELRLLVNISKQSATASKPQAYPVTETKRWVKKIENMKIKSIPTSTHKAVSGCILESQNSHPMLVAKFCQVLCWFLPPSPSPTCLHLQCFITFFKSMLVAAYGSPYFPQCIFVAHSTCVTLKSVGILMRLYLAPQKHRDKIHL